MRHDPALEALHAQIEKIEGRSRRVKSVLPFGIAEVDSRLPGGGLAHGALHEVAGGGNDAVNSAAAALFTAGIAARTRGKVLWCVARSDLFAPALSQADLKPDRVICLEAGDEKTILGCFEECLRHRGLGAAVAEVARLSMTASRRLQLAAEESGTIGIALRRWRRQAEASDSATRLPRRRGGVSRRCPQRRCPSRALAVPAGWSNWFAAAPARARISNWRRAMTRTTSVFLPIILVGREGKRQVVLATCRYDRRSLAVGYKTTEMTQAAFWGAV